MLRFKKVDRVCVRHAEILSELDTLGLTDAWLRFYAGQTGAVLDDTQDVSDPRNQGVYYYDCERFCRFRGIAVEFVTEADA